MNLPRRGFFLVLGALTLSACSFLPNSGVRVAVPESQRATWQAVARTLGPDAGLEVVAPGSFPPPDLVWFTGFDEDFEANALAPHAHLEALAQAAGVSRAWSDQRLYPLAWSPWSWWTFAPGTKLPPLTALDAPVLAAYEAATTRQMGGEHPTLPSTVNEDRVWLSWASVMASPERVNLVAQPGVAARARALWWNREGWNPANVPALLETLWSPEVRAVWAQEGWLGLDQGPVLEADQNLVIYTPANE